jgi:hypothetical protein
LANLDPCIIQPAENSDHMIKRPLLLLLLCSLIYGCRSPLADLHGQEGQKIALAVPPIVMEDHSRNLRLLRNTTPGEPNTTEARKLALDGHRSYLDTSFRARALQQGFRLDPASPYRLELTLTTVGEVRTKYIVYGILSGVAWGVGTGLVTHNARLAVGLGAYELVEESIFWIAGSSLFGRYSAPIVLEARIVRADGVKAIWNETYFVIWGGQRLKEKPLADQKDRSVQLHASLDRALDKLFLDLKEIPNADLQPGAAKVGLSSNQSLR